MFLVIDTSKSEKTTIALYRGRSCYVDSSKGNKLRAEDILIKINRLLSKCKISLSDIRVIVVNNCSGSYTGLRVGITTANILGWVLNIPVFGAKDTSPKQVDKIIKANVEHLSKFQRPVIPKYADELTRKDTLAKGNNS